jgi:hypothetical protein
MKYFADWFFILTFEKPTALIKRKTMKKQKIFSAILIAFLMFSAGALLAQDMKSFTWDTYKTKFSVPSDFRVTESSGTYWSGTNDLITLSIYPKKDENLTQLQMDDAVYNWAVSNGVKDIGTATDLDAAKLNGYWGVMYEGVINGFPVATMLIVDPDYPEISLYIWVAYTSGYEDTVTSMLMSFTPN